MSVDQLKAVARIGANRRKLGWDDRRGRSPKALGDMSGVILSRIGANTYGGLQDFDYDTLSKIYVCNDLAWTCIDLVSSTAALAKLRVRKREVTPEGVNVTFLPDHPLQQMLDFPNSSMTQFDLIQSYVTHQKLFGTVGILLLRENMLNCCTDCKAEGADDCIHKLWINNTGKVVQFMPVHPSTIVESDVKLPNGLVRRMLCYAPDDTRKYPIHPDNILTDPYYNTDISWYGVSPTHLLRRWLNLDQAMTSQVTQFFENGAIPSMLVSIKPGNNFSYEQDPNTLMAEMKSMWMSKFSRGGTEQKSPAFAYGDISVERIEERIDEAISKNLYYEITARVCATYGVPPGLYEVGMKYNAQRASAEQAEKDFYNRTISKILARLQSKINKLVVPSYGEEGLEVVWDLSEMGVASFLVKEQRESIKKDWELGLISRDQARVQLGYEPVGGELGDDFYRLTVMSDGSNSEQARGMDNRLVTPQGDKPIDATARVSTTSAKNERLLK